MNGNKVTLDTLSGQLAEMKGLTPVFAEKFAGEFFKVIQEALASDSCVTVKGLGKFICDEDGNVMFEADDNLAAKINEPFECFEPIELDDDEDIPDTIDEPSEETAENKEPEEAAIAETAARTTDDSTNENDSVEEEADQSEYIQADTPENEPAEERSIEKAIKEDSSFKQEITENAPIIVTANDEDADCLCTAQNESTDKWIHDIKQVEEETADETDLSTTISRDRKSFFIGLIIGLIVGAGGAIGVNYYLNSKESTSGNPTVFTKSAEEQTEDMPQTIEPGIQSSAVNPIENVREEEAPDKPEDIAEAPFRGKKEPKAITETVTATNYLASMARRHYGRFEFWVYIYEENSEKLSNPDLIEPNTIVVIPPAEKYGIDKNDPASVARAVAKSKEIYSRFKR